MPEIRIKVGVALDANAEAVLAPIERASKRVKKTVESEMGAAGKAVGDHTMAGARKAAAALEKLESDARREAARILKAHVTAEKELTRAKAHEIRERERAERQAATARERIERDAARAIVAARKNEEKRQANSLLRRDILTGKAIQPGGGAIGIGRRAGIRTSKGVALAYGLGGRALSSMTDIGLDFAHGLGADTDLGSHVQKAQAQRSLANKISASGYVPGTNLVDPNEIIAKAREVGNATGTDTSDALEALEAFVGKTGELKTGLESMEHLAVLSKATGTHLADMSNAAAEVSNQLGDVPNKGKVVYEIMKQIAGQGKLGAVEIKDLASQMAKIGAAASRFAGGAEKNIATLGAIAQEAKLRGGAASATQAATSVTAFATGLTKGATFKNWRTFRAPVKGQPGKFEGLNPYTDSSHRELSDPMEIIKAGISATRGDQTKLSKLFPSSQGFRAVSGFASVYNQAYSSTKGTDEQKDIAGIKAITDEFERLKSAQLDELEVHRAFAKTMQQGDSKAAIFNNKMTEIADRLTAVVLPHLDEFGNVLEHTAETVAGAFEAIFPEAKRQSQSETAEGLVGKEKATENVLKKTEIDKATGKKIYSAEAFDVAKNQMVQRNASIAKLQQQVAEERSGAAEATAASKSGGIFSGLYSRAAAAIAHPLGLDTAEDKASKLSGQAAKDQDTLEKLLAEQQSAMTVWREIQRELQTQTAMLSKPPPIEHPADGRAPAEADTNQ